MSNIKSEVVLYVGRQYGGESIAYVGRTDWDYMRKSAMESCRREHTDEQIAAALAEGIDAGIEGCSGGDYECRFYLDQTVTITVGADGILEVDDEVLL